MDSDVHSKNVEGVHQPETLELSVHRVPVGSVPWTDSPITDSLASSIVKGDTNESAVVKGLPYTLLSLVAGWWGIPWGPIFTIGALYNNLKGGKDVTIKQMTAN